MRLQYASDLHIEFQDNRAWLFDHGLKHVGDVLVLAGDIAYLGDRQLLRNEYFDLLSFNFEQVYIVPGNHEFYRGYELRYTLSDFEMKIRTNVRYLNNKSVIIDDTEIFFTTLWSKVPDAALAAVQNGMMDTRRICYKNALLYAGEYNELHRICSDWLADALDASTAKRKVVVTHHCPTTMDAFNGHIGSSLNCAFMVDMEGFMAVHKPDVWIFGHTHFNGDSNVLSSHQAVVGGTRLLTNQLGYVRYNEQKGFDPKATIEI